MNNRLLIPVNKLKKSFDLAGFDFNTTKEIPILKSIIGQKRAVEAIQFALEMNHNGYNLFVTGSHGSGRTTIVTDLIKIKAKKMPVPPDRVFVYNFSDPDEPTTLELPAGSAKKFKHTMQRLITSVRSELQKTFETKEYLEKRTEIINLYQNEKQALYREVEEEAYKKDIKIESDNTGFVTIPIKDNKPIDLNQLNELPEKERKQINKNATEIQNKLQDVFRKVGLLDRSLEEELESLKEKIASFIVNNQFEHIRKQYKQVRDIVSYLNEAALDIIENVNEFIGISEQENDAPPPESAAGLPDKYRINILIDNSKTNGAPIVYEPNPTYGNLFGNIEKKIYQGYVYSDYTMIKAGALLKANGGFLIIDAQQLLKNPFAYESLKRALRSQQLKIEDINELGGFQSAVSLKPGSIPIDLKVILIGHVSHYRLLYDYDEEFRKIFKVRADFDYEVKETSKSIHQYIQFIARVVEQEKLLHFTRDGVSAILEYSMRRTENQGKISIQFGEVVRIIRESSFWAKKKRHKTVKREDVLNAVEAKIYRHNLIEDKIHESYLENSIMVDLKGEKIGQINGLAVYSVGDYSFGRPSRITANTYIGGRGIVNIEREAKLSGKIHDKGMLILSGFFLQKFGRIMPLSFSATITFEQNYGIIDGDSASSTELYALLSSLSNVPIKQGIAVTGSVNQKGEIQPIGGVNEKIEGFFKVCKSAKLTGEQGVIIPKANIKNLMLNDEVVQAVKEGKFHIWGITKIEEGMEILTGRKCGRLRKDGSFTKNSIFDLVQKELHEFSVNTHEYHKVINSGTISGSGNSGQLKCR
jgi:lon-related putative ATP-dependent protease